MNPQDIVYDDGSYENKVAIFGVAADKLKVDIKDCMIVEGSVSGIHSGYIAGCRNIVIIDSSNRAEEYKTLSRVIKVIDNFKFK